MVITKQDLNTLVAAAARDANFYAPIKGDNGIEYVETSGDQEIAYGYVNVKLSPKGLFFPQSEVLCRFCGDTLKDVPVPDEKLIVFSFYRKTLSYLAERLLEDGIKSQVLIGGMKETKQEVISRFKESSDISVLLSSEVASEGVDLQFCRVLFNYDLPWNPMKVEQRIGRIDRIGQQAEKISIVNLLFANTIDHRIHDRLASG